MFGKKKQEPLAITWTAPLATGDIITVEGRRYKITKKTTTAVQAIPYSVLDEFCDWLGRKLKLS